jgi:hypothetical protein
MSHKHQHSCTCSHDRVRYCGVCQVVHCLDCNQEWSKRPQYATTWITSGGQTNLYPHYSTPTFEVQGNVGSSGWQQTVDTMLTTTCSHGG